MLLPIQVRYGPLRHDRVPLTSLRVLTDGEIKNADAAYVLAFSIIMLNTDLHSPSIRKRMTLEDYARNLKGVNDKADFSIEYMVCVCGMLVRSWFSLTQPDSVPASDLRWHP